MGEPSIHQGQAMVLTPSQLSLDPPKAEKNPPTEPQKISNLKAVTVIVTLSGVSFLNTMGSGILTAALPRIAQDVGLSDNLILWPAIVYALAIGCLLPISSTVADAIGPKLIWVSGGFLHAVLTIGLASARTGLQVILFRALLGVAISMCLPSTVSLITNTFERGVWRNVAFAMKGMGQPIGFAFGIILGGIFTDTIGWRWAYYLMAMINGCLSAASIWSLPTVQQPSKKSWTRRLVEDIDWCGALILSTALGVLSYVLATTTTSYHNIKQPQNIALLVISVLLLASFPGYMHFQTRKGKPALIPNEIWKHASFTCVCIAVFFCWATLNGMQFFIVFYFQKIQGLSALQGSVRFLAQIIMGVTANILMALLISRVKGQTLAVVSAIITMIAPALMATVDIGESYWLAPFWALLISSINADVLFTLSNIVISDAFPLAVQSVAGGVFYEVSQFGNSVGLAITAAIAASVTEHSRTDDPRLSLMEGYRVAFWVMFAGAALVPVVCFVGLRKSGTVGSKEASVDES